MAKVMTLPGQCGLSWGEGGGRVQVGACTRCFLCDQPLGRSAVLRSGYTVHLDGNDPLLTPSSNACTLVLHRECALTLAHGLLADVLTRLPRATRRR